MILKSIAKYFIMSPKNYNTNIRVLLRFQIYRDHVVRKEHSFSRDETCAKLFESFQKL